MLATTAWLSLGPAAWCSPTAGDAPPTELTAEQIVEKHVAARGGRQAWRAIQSMKIVGEFEAPNAMATKRPFMLELKRGRKTRLEIDVEGTKAVEVFDGTRGWKIRPYVGRSEVAPMTPIEIGKAAEQQDLDGPLIDHADKGVTLQSEGREAVRGHDTYRLKLTTKDGRVRRTWIDTSSFLEVKRGIYPRRIGQTLHPESEYYSDYRSVEGLLIPFDIQTVVEGTDKVPRKMVIERVVLNPSIDDQAFAEPPSLKKVAAHRAPATPSAPFFGALPGTAPH
jgi:hypothetical protein